MSTPRLALSGLCLLCTVGVAAQEQQEPPRLRSDGQMRNWPWQQVTEAPDWMAKPPRLAGQFHFSLVRRSHNSTIAMGRATGLCENDARRALLEHLAPSLGLEQAPKVVETLLDHTVLAKAATTGTQKIAGARGPGQTVAEAFMLWQIPVRAAIQELDAAIQGRVERALLHNVVAWEQANQRPNWIDPVAPHADHLAFVCVCDQSKPQDARRQSISQGRKQAHDLLHLKLASLLDEKTRARCVEAALANLTPVRRAMWLHSDDPVHQWPRIWTAVVRYEVAVAAIVRDLSEEQKDLVAKALR